MASPHIVFDLQSLIWGFAESCTIIHGITSQPVSVFLNVFYLHFRWTPTIWLYFVFLKKHLFATGLEGASISISVSSPDMREKLNSKRFKKECLQVEIMTLPVKRPPCLICGFRFHLAVSAQVLAKDPENGEPAVVILIRRPSSKPDSHYCDGKAVVAFSYFRFGDAILAQQMGRQYQKEFHFVASP